MLRKIRIQNYKSILDDSLELGRINVFIGENGCGKTNILEALAMAGAALHDDLDAEGLFNRGIRLAKQSLTTSAFARQEASEDEIRVTLSDIVEPLKILPKLENSPLKSDWYIESAASNLILVQQQFRELKVFAEAGRMPKNLRKRLDAISKTLMDDMAKISSPIWLEEQARLKAGLDGFSVYSPNTLALRGLQSSSRKEPLGIHGEGLDTAIASMSEQERQELTKHASCISWMANIVVDDEDRLKRQGFKPGRSTSTLYFMDRFMAEDNNVFSAENANEGILHVLFYLALFMSRGTPPIFGIDNIETALNPQLCRDLMKQLVELATKHDKQALITTHNPAVLDGLNLNDDEQRLFVVERDDEGHTKTRRVKLKPDAGDGKQYKLSELWMRGHLGGLPRGF